MGIEKIVKAWDYADSHIHSQYSKLVDSWEKSGQSRYTLASAMLTPSFAAFIGGSGNYYTKALSTGLISYDLMQNISGIIEGDHEKGISSDGESLIVTNSYFLFMEKISKKARLPLFLTGTIFAAKGALGLYSYLSANEYSSLAGTASDFSTSMFCFGLSSSLYIKDTKPKIRQKTPFISRIYSLIDKSGFLKPKSTIPTLINASYKIPVI